VSVIFVNPVGTVGGAERVLSTWVGAVRESLPAARRSAILFADGPLRSRLEALGVAVHVLPLPESLAATGDTALRGQARRPRRLLSLLPATGRFVLRLQALLKQLKPDLIHSNGLKAHLLTAAAKPSGTPLVWHLHDFYSERPVAKWGLKLARVAATGGIAISDAIRRDTQRLLPGFRVRTVLNAVDTAHFASGPGDPHALDLLAGLPPAAPGVLRIGLVATYANWKGHGVFLDALAKLPDTLAFRGYVIGGPIYSTGGSQVTHEELAARVTMHGLTGRVGLVPFQDDPVSVYRSLDIVVHASTRPEPFGLTVAEAMSCGRAVVVSAAGGAAELFRDGEDALGHSPGDVPALASVLTRLLTDTSLRRRLGEAARRTAVMQFGTGRLASEVEAAYRRFARPHLSQYTSPVRAFAPPLPHSGSP